MMPDTKQAQLLKTPQVYLFSDFSHLSLFTWLNTYLDLLIIVYNSHFHFLTFLSEQLV